MEHAHWRNENGSNKRHSLDQAGNRLNIKKVALLVGEGGHTIVYSVCASCDAKD